MRILAPALLVASLAFGTIAQAEAPNKLVTVLTAPEAQTQLMAMVLTMNAIAAGAKAEMLLCGPAGDIALKKAPETATAGQPPKGASPQGLMKMMMEKNGLKVQVCAIYLPGQNADAAVLLEGVTAAAPDAMEAAIVAPGTSLLTF